tara:strand:- start:2979 stop:3155 length:177 start_codon:yes stop_codon:yes gene_type:complete
MKALNEILIPYLQAKQDIKTKLMILLGINSDSADDIMERVIEDQAYDWSNIKEKPPND